MTAAVPIEAGLEPGATWPLPIAVRSLPKITWADGPHILGELVYGPPQTTLRILCAGQPILRDGVACHAIVFTGAEEKTRLIVARRLFRLIGDFGAALETIRLHEDANDGADGVVVLTVFAGQRDRTELLLLAALEQDQSLQRMLLRAGMAADRMKLDRSLIKDFRNRGGGVARHFSGPRTRRYRFSDFRLDDQVHLCVGVHLKLVFDDHEIMDFAMQRFEEFIAKLARKKESCVLRLLGGRSQGRDDKDTDTLWADESIMLSAGLNRHATRRQASEFLSMVCGLDGAEVPISESLLSEFGKSRPKQGVNTTQN